MAIRGRAATGDVVRDVPARAADGSPLLFAYAINELAESQRTALLEKLTGAAPPRASFLIVESIARRDKPWWPEWVDRLTGDGARADEWRFPSNLPPSLALIARGAGLDPRELTARTIYKP